MALPSAWETVGPVSSAWNEPRQIMDENERLALNRKFYSDQNKYYWEMMGREALGGLTLELGPLLLDRHLSDETKQGIFDQKMKHPFVAAATNIGLSIAGLALLPERAVLEAPKLINTLTGGYKFAEGTAASKSAVEAAKGAYRFAQGATEAKSYTQALQLGMAEGAIFGIRDAVNTASLDPNFTVENLGHYGENILSSVGLGIGARVLTHGIADTYSKYIKGNKELTKEVPVTFGEAKKFGTTLGETNPAFIKDAPDINAAVANTLKGPKLADNITFLNELDDHATGLMQDMKAKNPLDNNHPGNKAILFFHDLSNAPEVVKDMSLGKVSAREIYDKWSKRYKLYDEYSSNWDKIKNTLTRDIQQQAHEADLTQNAMRDVVENTLRDAEELHFSYTPNNTMNDQIKSGVMGKNGLFNLLDNTVKEGKDPSVYMIDNLTGKPLVNPETGEKILLDPISEKSLYEARKRVNEANRPNQQYVNDIGNIIDEFKNVVAKPIQSGSDVYLLRKDITPENLYKYVQKMRQNIDKKSYSLRKDLGSDVVGEKEDRFIGEVKNNIFNYIRTNFGELGEVAYQKTKLINSLNNSQENLLLFLNRKKAIPASPRKIPGREYFNKREAIIRDIYGKTSNISDNALNWKYQTARFKGELDKAQKGITESFDALQKILPNEDLSALNMKLGRSFENKKDIIDKIALLNDKDSEKLFQKGSIFHTAEVEAAEHGGLKTTTRFRLFLKDYFASFINPAESRYAGLQAFRIMEDIADKLLKKKGFLKSKEPISKELNNIAENRLKQFAEVLQKNENTNSLIRKVSQRITKPGLSFPPSQFSTHLSSLNNASSYNDINNKFDKIAKNLIQLRDDPMLYASRIEFALSSLKEMSPQIAEGLRQRIYSQMGLIMKIFPNLNNYYYYNVPVPLSEKARFLDSVDALTNPEKMLNLMADGTISRDQLNIFKISHPDIWQKTVKEVSNSLLFKSPSPEAMSKAYSMFGIKSIGSEFNTFTEAQQMLMMQMEAHKAKSLSKMKAPQLKVSKLSGYTKSANLTPQGMTK